MLTTVEVVTLAMFSYVLGGLTAALAVLAAVTDDRRRPRC